MKLETMKTTKLENMTAVLMKNPTDRPVRVPSEMIADWEEGGGARPAKVVIPAGATVAIRAEYCARSRANWTRDRESDPDSEAATMVIPSAISSMAPQLVPADDDAARFLQEVWHDQLSSVRRAFEELLRAGAASRGELKPATARPRVF